MCIGKRCRPWYIFRKSYWFGHQIENGWRGGKRGVSDRRAICAAVPLIVCVLRCGNGTSATRLRLTHVTIMLSYTIVTVAWSLGCELNIIYWWSPLRDHFGSHLFIFIIITVLYLIWIEILHEKLCFFY